MTDTPEPDPVLDSETEDFAQQVADSVSSFLLAVREIAHEGDAGRAIPLLLLEITQVSLTGARLGVQTDFVPHAEYQPDVGQTDFVPHAEYQPDVGPEADLEGLRLRLARTLDSIDTYSYVFDPYVPEVVESQLSDDITAIASDLENGLRHFRAGDVDEALWWWQFSYVASWGNLAGVCLNALLSVVSHNRLDHDFTLDAQDVAAADEILEEGDPLPS